MLFKQSIRKVNLNGKELVKFQDHNQSSLFFNRTNKMMMGMFVATTNQQAYSNRICSIWWMIKALCVSSRISSIPLECRVQSLLISNYDPYRFQLIFMASRLPFHQSFYFLGVLYFTPKKYVLDIDTFQLQLVGISKLFNIQGKL